MRWSEGERGAIAAALVLVGSSIEDPIKNKTADAGSKGKYAYAELPSFIDDVRHALAAQGCALLQDVEQAADGRLETVTCIIHRSGQYVEGRFPWVGVPKDPQASGSQATYARRYGLLHLLGLAPDKDDDGKAATEAARSRTAAPKPSTRRKEDPDAKEVRKSADDPSWTPEAQKAFFAELGKMQYDYEGEDGVKAFIVWQSDTVGKRIAPPNERNAEERKALLQWLEKPKTRERYQMFLETLIPPDDGIPPQEDES